MSKNSYPNFGIILVDDEPPWLRSLSMTLEGPGGYSGIIQCSDSRDLMATVAGADVGIILLDLTMPHISGEELLLRIVEEYPEITVIIMSGLNQLDTAVRCMRLGAFDYLVKTAEEDRILDAMRRAVQVQELQRENREMRRLFLSDTITRPSAFAGIITRNPAMLALFRYVEAVAGSTQPIMITGESGTGKELIARALHEAGDRSGPLVAVNVAGLDDNVFADTLFGHLRGAFTSAGEPRRGMVEQAAGGTLFLDEIGDLSLASQVKLLRLLQEGEYYPLGADKPKQARAQVIVATHQDLRAKEEAKLFRRDLYFRLRAHQIHLPPLRERRDDLPVLLDSFMEEAAQVFGKKKPVYPKELITLLSSYHFPGNIRELKAMVYDAVSVCAGNTLSQEPFVRAMGLGERDPAGDPKAQDRDWNRFSSFDRLPSINEAVDLLVIEAVRRAGGNQTIAGRMLGISQPALSRRLKLLREEGVPVEGV